MLVITQRNIFEVTSSQFLTRILLKQVQVIWQRYIRCYQYGECYKKQFWAAFTAMPAKVSRYTDMIDIGISNEFRQ